MRSSATFIPRSTAGGLIPERAYAPVQGLPVKKQTLLVTTRARLGLGGGVIRICIFTRLLLLLLSITCTPTSMLSIPSSRQLAHRICTFPPFIRSHACHCRQAPSSVPRKRVVGHSMLYRSYDVAAFLFQAPPAAACQQREQGKALVGQGPPRHIVGKKVAHKCHVEDADFTRTRRIGETAAPSHFL